MDPPSDTCRPSLEINRQSGADPVRCPIQAPGSSNRRRISIGPDVVRLDLHVRIQEPVEAECYVLQLAAIDAGVFEIGAGVAGCALLGFDRLAPVEVLVRFHATEHALFPLILAVFPGEEVEPLDIPGIHVDLTHVDACEWAHSRDRVL